MAALIKRRTLTDIENKKHDMCLINSQTKPRMNPMKYVENFALSEIIFGNILIAPLNPICVLLRLIT